MTKIFCTCFVLTKNLNKDITSFVHNIHHVISFSWIGCFFLQRSTSQEIFLHCSRFTEFWYGNMLADLPMSFRVASLGVFIWYFCPKYQWSDLENVDKWAKQSPENDWYNQNRIAWYKVRCHYSAFNFLQISHNRHPISRPWGRGMGSFLWVQSLTCFVAVIAILCVILWHSVPRYNGTALYI